MALLSQMRAEVLDVVYDSCCEGLCSVEDEVFNGIGDRVKQPFGRFDDQISDLSYNFCFSLSLCLSFCLCLGLGLRQHILIWVQL